MENFWSKYSSSSFNSDIKIFKDKFLTLDFDNVIRAYIIQKMEKNYGILKQKIHL